MHLYYLFVAQLFISMLLGGHGCVALLQHHAHATTNQQQE
jgi:hypothetical protein